MNQNHDIKALREELLYKPKNGWERISDADRAELDEYCSDYLAFADHAKTEREAVVLSVNAAQKAGFREFVPGMEIHPGDKLYFINRK